MNHQKELSWPLVILILFIYGLICVSLGFIFGAIQK